MYCVYVAGPVLKPDSGLYVFRPLLFRLIVLTWCLFIKHVFNQMTTQLTWRHVVAQHRKLHTSERVGGIEVQQLIYALGPPSVCGGNHGAG